MRLSFLFTFAVLIAASAFAQSPQEDLAPFLDDQTIAVARIQPDKLSDATLDDLEKKLMPAQLQGTGDWKSPLVEFRDKAKELVAAGCTDVYVVVSFLDVPRQPPFIVFVPSKDKKPEDLGDVANWKGILPGRIIGKAAVLGTPDTLDRLKDAKPSARPDLVTLLAAAPDVALRIAVSPSPEIRRIYGELLPPFPPNTVTIPSAELFAGAKSLTADVDLSDKPSLRVNIQAKDAAAAERWADAIKQGVSLAAQMDAIDEVAPFLNRSIAKPMPLIRGDRVEMLWTNRDERLRHLIADVLRPLTANAYEQAATTQSINSLKQIMLGLHNYHDTTKSFPPQAILSKDGKKLLSWRVAILPYLEEKPLYDQFHLDEPWDSEHNRKLIPKMPAVYASNLMPKAKSEQGFTPFVGPVGEGTLFGKKEGTAIRDISDGTSNTIAVVDAMPSAVEWTKPQDWEVDFKAPAKGWRSEPLDPKERLEAAFADGSVRRISATTAEDTLRWLLQIGDGNPIPPLE